MGNLFIKRFYDSRTWVLTFSVFFPSWPLLSLITTNSITYRIFSSCLSGFTLMVFSAHKNASTFGLGANEEFIFAAKDQTERG